MLYLLDANTLIDAKRDYYGFDRVPEFWEWLVHHGQRENIKIPVEVYQEFADQKDAEGKKDELAETITTVKTTPPASITKHCRLVRCRIEEDFSETRKMLPARQQPHKNPR